MYMCMHVLFFTCICMGVSPIAYCFLALGPARTYKFSVHIMRWRLAVLIRFHEAVLVSYLNLENMISCI